MNFAPEAISLAGLLVFVSAIAIIDLRTHRIPNLLCLVGVICALTSQIAGGGVDGALAASGGMAIGFGMFIPFYALKAFGAGDVKAMTAIGAFLGPELTIATVAATLIAGSLIGGIVLLRRTENLAAALYRVVGAIGNACAVGRERSDVTPSSVQERFPYGVAIAVGVVIALLWSRRV